MTGLGRTALAALFAAISPTLGTAAAAARPAPAPPVAKAPGLSAEKREKLNEAVREMSRKAVGSDEWHAAAGKVLGFAPEGARKVLPVEIGRAHV